ncbi:hypothetical protein SRHO_G00023060 [Serrasalmus rhombeus]
MCGEIIFGNGTKLDFVEKGALDPTVLGLAASNIIIMAVVLFLCRKLHNSYQKDAAEDYRVQINQAEDTDVLNYAALSFAQSSSSRRSRIKNSSDQPVYAEAEDTDVLNYAALSFAQSSSSRRSRTKNSSDQPVYTQNPFSRQGKQKFTVKQVLEQLEADVSDFGPEFDSDSDELFQPHERDGGESSSQDSDLSNDSSSDEDVLFAKSASPQMEPNPATKTYKWRKKDFELPDINFQGEQVKSYQDTATDTPLVYFRRFVSLDMLENIVEHTNQFIVQKHGKCVDTSVKELEQVLGMYLRMGLVQMSGVRQYWESEVRYGPVADVMSRNRFNLLLSVIHFVDNETASEEVKKDRLWKVRPFLDSFRRQCLTIAPRQKQSIDEMMVPYKGKFGGIRQYIKGKPHPWGFKVWARCDVTGLLHDFDIYQGKGGGNDGT